MSQSNYDVIIMGGGPGGATCATLTARQGRKVLLLEKELFPRHHIGESLVTETYRTFERIGVLDKLKASPYVRKHSVQFFSSSGKASRPFYFSETNPHESSVTWQVLRSDFDLMMLDHARENGAEVRQGAMVQDVLFEGEKAVGVRVKSREGKTEEIRCNVVVDATGLSALLSKKLGLRRPDPHLRKSSVYGYFRGARRDQGNAEGATLIIRTPDAKGWFWWIPLHDDMASVGLVCSPETLSPKSGANYAEVFEREIKACEPIGSRLESAEIVGAPRVISDFSYRSSRMAGPGYILIGDAYGFLDPVFSTGVHLALKSGEMAADAIGEAFEAGDFSGETLGSHAPIIDRGIEAFRKIVYAYYTPDFSIGSFIRSYPQHHKQLVDLLIGDVFGEQEFDIFESMGRHCELPEPLCATNESKQGVTR